MLHAEHLPAEGAYRAAAHWGQAEGHHAQGAVLGGGSAGGGRQQTGDEVGQHPDDGDGHRVEQDQHYEGWMSQAEHFDTSFFVICFFERLTVNCL